ncbi:MAG: dUTP diphosphatase [Clostridium sp.]|nr:dUTP diphosphatase [Clostridium sp.]
MNKILLKFLKLNEKVTIPSYQTEGAAGMDLCAFLETPLTLKPLERKLVPTGLKMELPKGYEAQVRPRSGMSIKHGITLINCVGTIDEDYRGELCVPVVNLSNEEFTINNGDRIAQMIISPVTKADIEVVQELSETQRGEGGFGSTGRK